MKKALILSIIINIILVGVAFNYKSKAVTMVVTEGAPRYAERKELISPYHVHDKSIVFVGDSHVQFNEWAELFRNPEVVNRGIAGETTKQLAERIESVAAERPAKIFIIIGTNDIWINYDRDKTLENYGEILSTINKLSPKTQVYACAVFPSSWGRVPTDKVVTLNAQIRKLVERKGYTFVDTYTPLVKDGLINASLTWDGIHLNSKGYSAIKAVLLPYVNGAQKS